MQLFLNIQSVKPNLCEIHQKTVFPYYFDLILQFQLHKHPSGRSAAALAATQAFLEDEAGTRGAAEKEEVRTTASSPDLANEDNVSFIIRNL